MALLYTSRKRTQLSPAYLAGLIAADGSLERNDPFITLASADRAFLDEHARHYLEAFTRRKTKSFVDRRAKVYKLRIYNRRAWELLVKRYGVPTGAKSRIVEPPQKLENEEEIPYLQGWFDGEAWIEILRIRSKQLHEYPRIGFKIRSEPIRNWAVEMIRKRGIRVTAYDRSDETFGLWINGFNACELFRKRIGFGYSKKNQALKRLVAKCRG